MPLLGAVAGLLVGIALLGLLAVIALFKNSPGGLEENRMWFGLFATIWGMPLSLLGGGSNLLAVAITVPLNWSLLGLLAGAIVEFRRRRRKR